MWYVCEHKGVFLLCHQYRSFISFTRLLFCVHFTIAGLTTMFITAHSKMDIKYVYYNNKSVPNICVSHECNMSDVCLRFSCTPSSDWCLTLRKLFRTSAWNLYCFFSCFVEQLAIYAHIFQFTRTQTHTRTRSHYLYLYIYIEVVHQSPSLTWCLLSFTFSSICPNRATNANVGVLNAV